MTASASWYPWRVARWRNSPRVLAMSLAGQGAYRNLLDSAWDQGGVLPNTPAVFWRYALARTPEEFAAVAEEVMPMFTPTEDGKHLHNETLTAEWNETTIRIKELHEKRSRAGLLGAQAKHGLASAKQNLASDGTLHNTTDLKPTSGSGEPSVPLSDLKGVVKDVFGYYLQKTGRNPNQYEFTDKRRNKGVARLKEFQKQCDGDLQKAAAMMRRAVDGICADPWEGRVKFREWDEQLFVSQEKAEKWRNAPLVKVNGKPAHAVIDNSAADRELARQLGRAQ